MSDREWVLGVDTSTVVNAAVAHGTEIIATASVADPMAHVEQLTPMIMECVSKAGIEVKQLSQIVVGLGPGPFTGLRVGVVTAQLLGSVLGCPVRGVCSLDVLARQHAGRHCRQDSDFVVATDARRREVYWARYGADGMRVGEPHVSSPDELPALPVVGPAADLYPGRLRAADGPRFLDPGVLAAFGPGLPAAGSEPLYLRRPDAAESFRRKSVLHYSPDRRGPRRSGGAR